MKGVGEPPTEKGRRGVKGTGILSRIERLLRNEGLEIEKWSWFEPTPRTLAFSRLLVYLEIMYTKTIREYGVLSFLTETVIVCARKR